MLVAPRSALRSATLRSPAGAGTYKHVNSPPTITRPEQLAVNARDAGALLGISRAQFFKLKAQGKVPLPVRMGVNAPRWRVAELRGWVAAGCPDRQTWERLKLAQKGV